MFIYLHTYLKIWSFLILEFIPLGLDQGQFHQALATTFSYKVAYNIFDCSSNYNEFANWVNTNDTSVYVYKNMPNNFSYLGTS